MSRCPRRSRREIQKAASLMSDAVRYYCKKIVRRDLLPSRPSEAYVCGVLNALSWATGSRDASPADEVAELVRYESEMEGSRIVRPPGLVKPS